MSRTETRRFGVQTADTQRLIDELIASLGLDKNTVSELVVEPWGISAWVYLTDDFGHRYMDKATRRLAREHLHYPSPLIGETP